MNNDKSEQLEKYIQPLILFNTRYKLMYGCDHIKYSLSRSPYQSDSKDDFVDNNYIVLIIENIAKAYVVNDLRINIHNIFDLELLKSKNLRIAIYLSRELLENIDNAWDIIDFSDIYNYNMSAKVHGRFIRFIEVGTKESLDKTNKINNKWYDIVSILDDQMRRASSEALGIKRSNANTYMAFIYAVKNITALINKSLAMIEENKLSESRFNAYMSGGIVVSGVCHMASGLYEIETRYLQSGKNNSNDITYNKFINTEVITEVHEEYEREISKNILSIGRDLKNYTVEILNILSTYLIDLTHSNEVEACMSEMKAASDDINRMVPEALRVSELNSKKRASMLKNKSKAMKLDQVLTLTDMDEIGDTYNRLYIKISNMLDKLYKERENYRYGSIEQQKINEIISISRFIKQDILESGFNYNLMYIYIKTLCKYYNKLFKE